MINQRINEKSNETVSLDFSLNDNQLNKLVNQMLVVKRQWGISLTTKIYPFVDKDILSKRIAR